jgi:hypothetical protein
MSRIRKVQPMQLANSRSSTDAAGGGGRAGGPASPRDQRDQFGHPGPDPVFGS